MNFISKTICKLLMIPATVSYYAPITRWVKQLGRKSFFRLPVADIKWKLVYKRGFARIFVGKPYALSVAAIRLGSLREGWKRIYGQKQPSLPERLRQIVEETVAVQVSSQYIDLPAEWKYKPGETASAALHEYVSELAPDFVLAYESEEPQTPAVREDEEIGVVIPVYNGKQHLEVLLPSLFKNTTQPHKFIFVNDCSPDQTVLPWLKEQCADREDCVVLENTENLGFPATVNKGAALCKGHFVILNTDTEVPACWLERLMQPIWEDSQVASVTPFSDAATIFSFPFVGNDAVNQQFRREIGMERINEVLRQVAPDAPYLDAPTGVGFCMAINGDVWRQIGGLDAETFGKGYGEENDWCQRAIKAGYKNVLNSKLYVAHHHGGSFETDKKKQLIAKASELISGLHPNYFKDVSRFIADDPWKKIRAAGIIRLLMQLQCRHELYLSFTWGGGSEHYLNFQVQTSLSEGECAVVLAYDSRKNEYSLALSWKDYRFVFNNVPQDIVKNLEFAGIDKIAINQLVSWDGRNSFAETADWVTGLKEHMGCPMLFLAHDLFPICPGITTLKSDYSLCPVSPKCCDCSHCASVNSLWKKADLSLKNWHENWGRILDCSDEIRCFSQSTANYYKKFFSSISEKLTVVPHANQTSSEEKLQVYTDSLNICVVGAISQIKGSIVISALAKKLKKSHPDARIYIIGSWFGADLHSNMCLVSPYDKHHLLDILHYLKATMCLFPTICPETFSYVISELKELDAPIISFNLGAQGERLASYPKGVLVDEISADAAYDAVVKLYENLKSAKRRD